MYCQHQYCMSLSYRQSRTGGQVLASTVACCWSGLMRVKRHIQKMALAQKPMALCAQTPWGGCLVGNLISDGNEALYAKLTYLERSLVISILWQRCIDIARSQIWPEISALKCLTSKTFQLLSRDAIICSPISSMRKIQDMPESFACVILFAFYISVFTAVEESAVQENITAFTQFSWFKQTCKAWVSKALIYCGICNLELWYVFSIYLSSKPISLELAKLAYLNKYVHIVKIHCDDAHWEEEANLHCALTSASTINKSSMTYAEGAKILLSLLKLRDHLHHLCC